MGDVQPPDGGHGEGGAGLHARVPEAPRRQGAGAWALRGTELHAQAIRWCSTPCIDGELASAAPLLSTETTTTGRLGLLLRLCLLCSPVLSLFFPGQGRPRWMTS